MAVAAAVDRKSVFRQALTALRYAVAGAVTVVVVMTAVYAFRVAARSDNLYILDVVDGHISVQQNSTDSDYANLSFTLRVDNPSGRVRFYYTGIQCIINASVSGTDPVAETFSCPDMVVAPDSVLKFNREVNHHNPDKNSLIHHLFHLNKTMTGNLTLNGSLTVGVYSAYNRTSVAARYCCRSVTVGKVNYSSPDYYYDDYDDTRTRSSPCIPCLANDEPARARLSTIV